jgi:hypothetical protein
VPAHPIFVMASCRIRFVTRKRETTNAQARDDTDPRSTQSSCAQQQVLSICFGGHRTEP